jgi:hypothetical protein
VKIVQEVPKFMLVTAAVRSFGVQRIKSSFMKCRNFLILQTSSVPEQIRYLKELPVSLLK